MSQIALSQEPLDVAVGCGAKMLAAQGRTLVAVAACVGFVALGAVFAVDPRACRDCFRLAGEWTNAGVVFSRNVIPVWMDGCGNGQRGAESDGED